MKINKNELNLHHRKVKNIILLYAFNVKNLQYLYHRMQSHIFSLVDNTSQLLRAPTDQRRTSQPTFLTDVAGVTCFVIGKIGKTKTSKPMYTLIYEYNSNFTAIFLFFSYDEK